MLEVFNQISTCDSVLVAAQTGRLDLVSALLAIIALLIGISAIPIFLILRKHAGSVAKDTTTEYMDSIKEEIERQAVKTMEEMLPKLAEDYVLLIAENKVNEHQADDIARAQEGDD